MKKLLGILALVGLLALPMTGLAATLEERIEALNRETIELKLQLEEIRQQQVQQEEFLTEIDETIFEDKNSRFQWSGDFRTRYDYYSRERYTSADTTTTDKNKSLFTNRLRLNMSVRALENVEFVGRLAMYKAWGMQNTPSDNTGFFFGGYPAIDGNSGRTPVDNKLLVDRAIVNWTGIGGSNFWFSVGRRPTTDGPPSQLRLNSSSRMATPVSYMDWPFDGATLGYAYDSLFGAIDLPGRIRFCYGRGYEAGIDGINPLNDTDFAGISWDIYNKNNRFVYLQSYVAMEVFNYPDIADANVAGMIQGMMGDRDNIGDIYHTSLLYMDKFQNFNYFVNGAWSRTDPNSKGMFNDPMAGAPNTSSENGYSIYVGGRFDIPRSNFKVGAEYNYGSEYWIGMSPGHDDMYASKLATRGHVIEVYGIYDLPGKAVAKLGAASFRFGYQHYRYDYTGSLDWNLKPYDVSSFADRQTLDMFASMGSPVLTVKSADQVYASFDVKF